MLLTTVSILSSVLATSDATVGESSETLIFLVVEIAVLLVWVIALAGLWRFRNWARVLYLAVAAVGLVGSLLLGGEQRSGAEVALSALCWLVTGAIIALAYWSPLAATFRAKEQVV